MRWRLNPLKLGGLLVLSVLNAAFLADVVLQANTNFVLSADGTDGVVRLPDDPKEAGTRKPIEAYDEILAHPVFFKSREPFIPPPDPSPEPADTHETAVLADPNLAVGGVVIKDGLTKAFLFSRDESVAGTWVSQGETVQGWQVKSITKSGVVLEQGGRSIDLQLYPDN